MMILFELFAVLSWYIIAVIVVGIIAVGVCLENDLPGLATFAVIGALVAVVVIGIPHEQILPSLRQFFTDLPEHFGWIALYLLVGAAWSVFKWGFYVKNLGKGLVKNINEVRREYSDKESWINNFGNDSHDPSWKEEEYVRRYKNSLASATNDALRSVISQGVSGKDIESLDISAIQLFQMATLTVSNRKGLIAGWIAYWPISMLVTSIREFVIDLFENIINALQGVYNYVTKTIVTRGINAALSK